MTVRTLDDAGVHGIGGVGVGFVVGADSGAAGGPVGVIIDVSGFQWAFGGGFASRLKLIRVPACAVDLAMGSWRETPPPGCTATREDVYKRQTLASYANLALYSSMAVFALAMLAYTCLLYTSRCV